MAWCLFDMHLAILWTNAALFLIRPYVTYFNQFLFVSEKLPFNKMHLKYLQNGKNIVSASMDEWDVVQVPLPTGLLPDT